jgi:hypothetical protein
MALVCSCNKERPRGEVRGELNRPGRLRGRRSSSRGKDGASGSPVTGSEHDVEGAMWRSLHEGGGGLHAKEGNGKKEGLDDGRRFLKGAMAV